MCEKCSFAFSKEMPLHENFFEQRYDTRFNPESEFNNHFKDNALDKLFLILKKYKSTPAKLFDVGSFAGVLLNRAKLHGYETEGVETNPTMAKYTQDTLKFNVHNTTFLNYEGSNDNFDIITLIDVLEHLQKPNEVIVKCHRLLKREGLLLIKIPNYKSQLLKQKIINFLRINNLGIILSFAHLNHFTPKVLATHLSNNGFEILLNNISPSDMYPSNYKFYRFRNFFRKAAYYLLKIFKLFTGINLGFHFYILARKK